MITNLSSFSYFIPELILSAVALLLICMAAFRAVVLKEGQACPCERFVSGVPSYIAAFGLAISLYYITRNWAGAGHPIFDGILFDDRPARFFKGIFALTALGAIVLSRSSAELAGMKDDCEYYALIIGMVVGMYLLAASQNILMIYLSLEFVGLTSYLLVGFSKDSFKSSEAALKYVLYGAVASGVFLFGASIFYGATGTLDIQAFAVSAPGLKLIYLASGILMLAGFLFKIAAVPMQAWCPDVYQGAPTPITTLLSVAPKAAGFAVIMRVGQIIGLEMQWPIIIAAVSALTMTFGNLAAITQTNVKRLLAYSSIAHAGFLLMGVACASKLGNEAVYFYFIAYLLMNVGAFLVVLIVANNFGSEDISAFSGLGRRGRLGTATAIAMTIFLLSLTGVPPFVGFIGKFYLFSAVIKADLLWLAVIGIINSVISLYYYMRIVKAMFFEEGEAKSELKIAGAGLPVLLGVLSIAVIVMGLAWGTVSRIVNFVVG